jgi:hypothetical protein
MPCPVGPPIPGREEDRGHLLHPQDAVKRPFPMILEDGLALGHASRRDGVHTGILALGLARVQGPRRSGRAWGLMGVELALGHARRVRRVTVPKAGSNLGDGQGKGKKAYQGEEPYAHSAPPTSFGKSRRRVLKERDGPGRLSAIKKIKKREIQPVDPTS